MLLLAMTCLRADEQDADVARAILRGDMHDGLRMGLGRLDRADGSAVGRQAALGQVMAQVLLAIGRIEQAEELLQGQLRLYASLSRPQMRWMASLDRGYFSLSLNKPGRAAESFNVVADGNEVPLKLRLEALLGLSSALHRLGEFHRASRTLAHAVVLAQQADALRLRLLEATRLEHEALEVLRDYDVSCEATRDRGGARAPSSNGVGGASADAFGVPSPKIFSPSRRSGTAHIARCGSGLGWCALVARTADTPFGRNQPN